MRIARFNGGRTGIVVGDTGLRIVDVLASLDAVDPSPGEAIRAVLPAGEWPSWVEMIRRWDSVRDGFAALEHAALNGGAAIVAHAFDDVVLDPPLASPTAHIFAIASNTPAHIIKAFKILLGRDLTEDDARKPQRDGTPPLGFMVWPSTLAAPDALVTPPRGTQKFDYEGECAVYVKAGGRYLDHVELWGYTAFNDFGVRDTHLQLAREAPHGPFAFNVPKNFDTGNACGPWVVVDAVDDLAALRCVVTVNGKLRQDWRLAEMVYNFDETLSFLSHNLTLQPGDMLASGTGAGVAFEGGVDGPYLKPGDVVEVRLDGAGTLRNTIGDW